MISTSQTRWPWVYCPVASTRDSCGSAAFPWTGGICALGLEAPGLASNPTSELSDKVRLPAFLSLTPKFTFPLQDSPAEHPVFGKLSCGKPQVHVRPNNQPQTTTEISMFRIIFLSSLWSGVPALRPLLARVLGPLAGCISKRMVCFKLPLLDPLSLSQSMKSPRVDQLLIIPWLNREKRLAQARVQVFWCLLSCVILRVGRIDLWSGIYYWSCIWRFLRQRRRIEGKEAQSEGNESAEKLDVHSLRPDMCTDSMLDKVYGWVDVVMGEVRNVVRFWISQDDNIYWKAFGKEVVVEGWWKKTCVKKIRIV